jgi:asparagine synthase (glutamine-hydrolysing)
MSGICAVCNEEGSGHIASIADSVAACLSLEANRERLLRDRDGVSAALAVSVRYPGQQMYGDERVLLVCDADLIDEAELVPAGFSPPASETNRTAALLAALYHRVGTDFVTQLRGGFSVILWDRIARRLVAAIDGFGIKRLVYHPQLNGLVVSSRVDALARGTGLDSDVNPRAIANILNFSSNLAPETIFTRVHRLGPGERLIFERGQLRVEKYWDMSYGLGDGTDEATLSRKLEAVVERSVSAHCRQLVSERTGAYLSGGTDSSTVVGMMARAAHAPVKAFSIGFQEQRFNELEYANIAARRFGSQHSTFLVGARDCFEALPHMVGAFDEPFGNSSAIPTYFCARLAAENGVDTLLAGDGGDELFGGNERYAADKIFAVYHSLPGILRRGIIEPVLKIPAPGSLFSKGRRYVRRANLPGVERVLSYHFLRTHPLEEVFESDFLHALGGYTVVDTPAAHYAGASAADHLDRLLYVDMKITLADNDLPKVTCMSELAGIRTRFPYLDRSVAEFSGKIPARLKVKGFEKRYLFKRAFRNLLPPEIIRKKKHGFGIPVAVWLRSDRNMRELSRDVLLSARSFGRGYFRRRFIEDLFQRMQTDDSTYYGDTLWTLLVLELWHCQVGDRAVRAAS